MSEEFTGILSSVFSGNEEAREAGLADVHDKIKVEKDRIKEMGFFANKNRSIARVEALQGAVFASELAVLKASGKSDEEIREKAAALAKMYGTEANPLTAEAVM
jgi:hypothetical protein